MFDAKRIEIVVPEYCVPDLLECIGRHGVDGYTLFRGLSGRAGQGPAAIAECASADAALDSRPW